MTLKKKVLATEQDPPLPAVLKHLSDMWPEWIAHRQEIGKPMTLRAARMALKELESMGPVVAKAAITHSIASGYQGIFPPPNTQKQQASGHPKAPSMWELKQKLESKQLLATQLMAAYSLQYKDGQLRNRDQYEQYQALRKEIRCIQQQMAE